MEIYWLEQTLADVPAGHEWLSFQERSQLSRMRFPKRRADWRLGRWTAKQAVAARLNFPSGPDSLAMIEIRPASSGAPEVFIADRAAPLSISISHSNGVALCCAGSSRLHFGCDLERIEARGSAFLGDYFTQEEVSLVEHRPADERLALITLMWSAKESALKALREGLRLDTRCFTVNLGPELPVFSVFNQDGWGRLRVTYKNVHSFDGRWRVETDFVRTVVSDTPFAIPLEIQPSRTSKSHAVCASGTIAAVLPRPA